MLCLQLEFAYIYYKKIYEDATGCLVVKKRMLTKMTIF